MQRRNTNQREIVYNSLELLGHANTECLIEYINNNFQNISLATIYRNLNILLEEGRVNKISIAGEEFYEIDRIKHAHFRCNKCNEIYDISIDSLPKGFKNLPNLGEFEVLGCDCVFYGICQKCKSIQ